jgi:parallel beta-helix repeat protein
MRSEKIQTSLNTILAFFLWIVLLFNLACTSTTNQPEVYEINVADFGMIPDDNRDDAEGIAALLQECKNKKAVRIVFPKGQYDFKETYAADHYFHISNNDKGLKRVVFPIFNMNNVTIDGRESLLMFHGRVNPFIISHSNSVVIKNLSLDFARAFHSEGKIIASHNDGLEIEMLPEYPFQVINNILLFTDGTKGRLFPDNIIPVKRLHEFDAEKREIAYMGQDFYLRGYQGGVPAKSLGGRKVRLLDKTITGTVGNIMVFEPTYRKYPGFAASDCKDVVFKNVTVHHAGGMGIIGQRTHNVTVDSCTFAPSKGRIFSTTADATHFVNMSGQITLSNSLFENMGDDATNIHGIYVQIVEIKDNRSLVVKLMHHQQRGFHYIQPGKMLEFVEGKSMITYDTATVQSVEHYNNQYSLVTFNSDLPNSAKVTDALAETRDYPEVTIANNIISGNRARGMLLNCRGKTRVENNTFHSEGCALLFEGDSHHWFEQGGVRDCTIRNNIFLNCLYGKRGTTGKGVIGFKPGIVEKRETSRYNRNIIIEDNEFHIFDDIPLLNAYCADGITWRNNTIIKTTAYPNRGVHFKKFDIQYCDNVNIEGYNE